MNRHLTLVAVLFLIVAITCLDRRMAPFIRVASALVVVPPVHHGFFWSGLVGGI